MGTESISAIIAIAVIVIGGGIILYKTPPARNPISYLLLATGVILSLFFGFAKTQPYAAATVQIWLLFGLVVVTSLYAWSTQKMAEEMREQRLSEERPYLLLKLTNRVVQWNDSPNLREHFPPTFPIAILNAGQGPAIDLNTALWNKGKKHYVYDRKGYLIPGEEWQAEISRFTTLTEEKEGWLPQLRNIVEQNKTGIIAVEYKDVHKRTWVSYLYLEKHAQDSAFVIAGEHNIMELKK